MFSSKSHFSLDLDAFALERVSQFRLAKSSMLKVSSLDEPATQCAKGLQLFFANKPDEALPLLEAGFAGRSEAAFVNSDHEARCALALAKLRDRAGNHSQALAPYQVAQEIFKTNGNDELESICLNSMGLIYHNQGRYALALSSYHRGLLIKQKIADRAGEGDALNGLGLVYANQGRHAEALEQFTLALEIRREIEEKSGEGETINHIAALYDQQGKYDEALDYYNQALAIRHALGDRVGEGITLNGIGLVYAHQGKYALALEQFTQALQLRREVGNRAGEGRTLNEMAGVYRAQGKYHEALKQYNQALTISREVQDGATEGTILNSMGLVYHDLGKYSEALEQFTQALELFRDANAGDRHDEGRTVNNIGLVYQAQGRYSLALEQFIQALHMMREANLGDRAGEGGILNNIGSVYRAQGKHEQALVEYQKALDIRREVGDRANEGSALNNIALVYRGLGKYEEALESYQKALELRREVGDRAGEGTTINNMGGLYRAQGEYDKALEQFTLALEIFREIGYPAGESAATNNIGLVYHNQEKYDQALTEFSVALQLRREIGNRAALGATLTNMGLAYEEQGQVEAALEHYEEAIEVFEGLRTTAGSEEARASFIAQHASLYDRAISIYHQQGRGTVAYQTSEQARARSFLDSLSTGYVQLWDDEAADLWTDEREAYNARQAAQEALIRARAQERPDTQLVADLEAIFLEAEEEHTAAMTAISARGDQLTALVSGRSGVPTLSEVQALLDESPRQRGATTLISYWLLGDDDTLAFILTPDELGVVPLGVGEQELTEQIKAFSLSFATLWDDNEPHQSDELLQLYDWLIRPLNPYLKTKSVTIVPHRILHYLPFAALTDGESYLSDDYVLSTLPSASVLPSIQENRKPDALIESVLALGNPTYDQDLIAQSGLILPNLPSAKQEVEALTNLFGNQVEAHFGTDATESTLREAGQANILHLAAHAIYNSSQPLDSKLILAGDATNDGLLEVGEVYGLELTESTLVVLSACETGLQSLNKQQEGQSVISAGDEIVALNRAFLFAGTPTVISTLWSVEDASTGLFMEHFYTHLRAGMSKADALRQAQLSLRAHEKYRHPYYWAGFVLSGDGGEISDSSGLALWLGGAALLLLAVVILVVVYRQRRDKSGLDRKPNGKNLTPGTPIQTSNPTL